jgi:hypothetical protein
MMDDNFLLSLNSDSKVRASGHYVLTWMQDIKTEGEEGLHKKFLG